MRHNPYLIQGPALISVSGGRTSGFMLRQIIDAHGGKLPEDVIPVFCNTGREHEATLQFLKEIGERWCPIVWLEYRHNQQNDGPMTWKDRPVHTFEVVNYCSASRNGEPFEQSVRARNFMPQPRIRFCTTDLKVLTAARYATSLGWSEYSSVVGLRHDEPRRLAKLLAQNNDSESVEVVCPMHTARHELEDVLRFWIAQPFDLQLPGGNGAFGNCDLCFLKTRAKLDTVMRTMPEAGEWWARQEETIGHPFRIDRATYRQMMTQLTVQGRLLDDAIEDDTLPCSCTD